MFLKRLFEFLPSVLAAIAFFLIGQYVALNSTSLVQSLYLVLPTAIGVLLFSLASNYLEDFLFGRSIWPEMLAELRAILLSAVRNGYSRSTTTTIEEWAALEDQLGDGAIVYIMTHDLYLYDCAVSAYETTARNLRDGVRYVYYLDRDVHDCAANELYDLIFKYLINNSTQEVADVEKILSNNLTFRKLRYPLLYPFSIVKLPGAWAEAHWYTAEPVDPTNSAGGTRLVVLEITNRDHGDKLLRIFEKLANRFRSRELKCQGLRQRK